MSPITNTVDEIVAEGRIHPSRLRFRDFLLDIGDPLCRSRQEGRLPHEVTQSSDILYQIFAHQPLVTYGYFVSLPRLASAHVKRSKKGIYLA